MNAEKVSAGGQVVNRVAALLRAVSESTPQGARTSDLAQKTRLPRPTAHRILTSLNAQGFVDRSKDGNWHLGPELFLMGAVAAERYDVTAIADEHIRALSEESGESAFLSVRRNQETVCLVRHEGTFPIRSFVLHEGKRFPLGVASAGLAILSFLPDHQVVEYLRGAELQRSYGASHSSAEIWGRIQETRKAGWALNPGLVVEGSWGMGAAVFNSAGLPAWALSLTGIEPRFSPKRQAHLGRLLLHHSHELGKRLTQRPAHSL